MSPQVAKNRDNASNEKSCLFFRKCFIFGDVVPKIPFLHERQNKIQMQLSLKREDQMRDQMIMNLCYHVTLIHNSRQTFFGDDST